MRPKTLPRHSMLARYMMSLCVRLSVRLPQVVVLPSQVKSLILTDAGSLSLYVRIVLKTLVLLFNNIYCQT